LIISGGRVFKYDERRERAIKEIVLEEKQEEEKTKQHFKERND
jgi:hypothetical protein